MDLPDFDRELDEEQRHWAEYEDVLKEYDKDDLGNDDFYENKRQERKQDRAR